MSENAPNEERVPRAGYVGLAYELSQRREGFPFPGIRDEAYARIKAEEEDSRATPIDILIARFHEHGMKIVLGKNPESGNVYVLPCDSDSIEEDSLFPRHLKIDAGMNTDLKTLISLNVTAHRDKGFS